MQSENGAATTGKTLNGSAPLSNIVHFGIVPRPAAIQQHRRLNPPPSSQLPSSQNATGHAISPRLDTDGDERDAIDVTQVFEEFTALPHRYAQLAARLRQASPTQAGDLIESVARKMRAVVGE